MKSYTKYLPLTIILVCTVLMAIISPLSSLSKSEKLGFYAGPDELMGYKNLNYLIYILLTVGLIIGFIYLTKQALNTLILLLTIALTISIVLITYPPIYDTLYYYTASVLWISHGINPYSEFFHYLSTHPFPYLEFPLYHNYPYGSLWFMIHTLCAYAANNSYLIFNTLLTLTTTVFLATTSLAIHWLKPNIHIRKIIIYIFLNPVSLVFLLRTGNPESLMILLILLSLLCIKAKRYLIASTCLVLLLFTKHTTAPLVLITYLWIVREIANREPSRIKQIFRLFVPALIISAITYWKFNVVLEYFSGGMQILHATKLSGISIQTIIVFLTGSVIPVDYEPMVNVLYLISNSIFILCIVFLGLKIISKKSQREEDLYTSIWIISYLSTYILGISTKPWYLFIPLVISLLLSEFKQYISTLIIMITLVGDFFLFFITVSPHLQVVPIILDVLLKEIIPLLMVIIAIRHESFDKFNRMALKLISNIVPAIQSHPKQN